MLEPSTSGWVFTPAKATPTMKGRQERRIDRVNEREKETKEEGKREGTQKRKKREGMKKEFGCFEEKKKRTRKILSFQNI